MSMSHRLSGRVTNDSTPSLVSTSRETVTGADRGRIAERFVGSSALRLGRRGLGRVAQDLSDRDLAIVRSVAEYRFLTALQLEQLHFVAGPSTSLSTVRTARRTLARLVDRRLLIRLDRRIGGLRGGSASFVYALGPIGDRLLKTPGPRRRHQEPSRTFLAHCLAISDLFVSLATAARQGALELVSHKPEPACWRTVPEIGGSVSLRPDLSLVLARQNIEWHWFVEVDLGTEHRPAIRRKNRLYQTYYQSGVEQAQRGVFPRIAWLTPSEARRAELASIIAGDDGTEAALFEVGTLDHAVSLLAPEVTP